MYYVQDAHSFWDWIYFVLLIVVSAPFPILIARRTQYVKYNEQYALPISHIRVFSTGLHHLFKINYFYNNDNNHCIIIALKVIPLMINW